MIDLSKPLWVPPSDGTYPATDIRQPHSTSTLSKNTTSAPSERTIESGLKRFRTSVKIGLESIVEKYNYLPHTWQKVAFVIGVALATVGVLGLLKIGGWAPALVGGLCILFFVPDKKP